MSKSKASQRADVFQIGTARILHVAGDTSAMIIFPDGSTNAAKALNGIIWISKRRPPRIGPDGETIERDESEAANFARRLFELDGQRPTREDEEIFSCCERLLLSQEKRL